MKEKRKRKNVGNLYKGKKTTLKNIHYVYFASFTNFFRAKIVILINLE